MHIYIYTCAYDYKHKHKHKFIQVFVEALDKCFENVCELDLIFNPNKAHFILDEIIMAGMVLETSLKEIVHSINGINKYEAATKSLASQSKTRKIGGGRQ